MVTLYKKKKKLFKEQYLQQNYLFVIIQHSVHVFNPNSINRTIKQDPLSIIIGVTGILSECVGQNTCICYIYEEKGKKLQKFIGKCCSISVAYNKVSEYA